MDRIGWSGDLILHVESGKAALDDDARGSVQVLGRRAFEAEDWQKATSKLRLHWKRNPLGWRRHRMNALEVWDRL